MASVSDSEGPGGGDRRLQGKRRGENEKRHPPVRSLLLGRPRRDKRGGEERNRGQKGGDNKNKGEEDEKGWKRKNLKY